ncbi:MAG: alkyl sulfatase dimerization domain-containing protein, partial [Gammaproteobacteria bacterium]|nr:alkyl sulfatase dimerization domain-containing protein [Gammaproteobacteria bacterium]
IRYRDAIQYVHDKTVYGMNNGKGVFALMQEISLPERLDVGQKYGSVAWSVRGIYEGYVGWFDEKPESIYSVPRETVYPDLVDLAGGPDRVAALAKEKLVDGNLVEGLYLTSAALWVDSKHRAALETRIRLLEALEDGAGNFNERAWLRHARKLSEGKLAED